MKKGLLLAICLIIAGTGAFAQCNCGSEQCTCNKQVQETKCNCIENEKTVCPETTEPATSSECTKKRGCPLAVSENGDKEQFVLDTDSTKYGCPPCGMFSKGTKKFICKVERGRAVVYNALNLTDCQIKKREELLKKHAPEYKEKYESLKHEASKLKTLKMSNAEEKEITKQKRVVKNIKKDILNLQKKETNEFKKYLTRAQRAKYNEIQKLQKKDAKKDCCKKDFYKSNPQMKEFGCPKSCPVKSEEVKE